MAKTLAQMQDEVMDYEKNKGWYPNENTFGDSCALLHSEISEALEGFREIGLAERTRNDGKPDDVASEFIDVLIRLFSSWNKWLPDLSMDEEYERKMDFNRTRAWKHGGKAL